MALRSVVLGYMRLPVRTLNRAGSKPHQPQQQLLQSNLRFMSSHDHPTKDQVSERVVDIVKSFPKVDPSKVSPDVHFQKDLGLDSLDNVEIVMAIEEEFRLAIPDKEAVKIDSCNLAIEYVYTHPMSV